MEKYINKQCKTHGETQYIYEKASNRYRCVKCRSEAVQKRRLKLKEMAIHYKGGKCICCEYNKCDSALEFHHLDPKEKEFNLGLNGVTRSWEKNKKELDKCVLVCANCHREIHAGIIDINNYLDKLEK